MEELFGLGRFIVGGAFRVTGTILHHAAEPASDLVANTMDTFDIPGGDLVRDHGKIPLELIGRGLDKVGEYMMEE